MLSSPPDYVIKPLHIARELHLDSPKDWVTHIKKSMKKLAQARYEFTGCFIKSDDDGKRRINTHFSLYSEASLFEFDKKKRNSKRNSESIIIFPKEIRENLEAKYYQLLDMVLYRELPEGLPRRLYEYLDKKRYLNINGKFTISEEAICRWLPIKDKHVTQRRKRLQKIAYALIEAGYLAKYEFDRKKKHCIYIYADQYKQKQQKNIANLLAKPLEQEIITTVESNEIEIKLSKTEIMTVPTNQ